MDPSGRHRRSSNPTATALTGEYVAVHQPAPPAVSSQLSSQFPLATDLRQARPRLRRRCRAGPASKAGRPRLRHVPPWYRVAIAQRGRSSLRDLHPDR
jgi:hypothetical protein